MSNIVASEAREFSAQELALIRDTVAKNATPEEFKLFLYRCKHMGLDPLKPGQIHFVKYQNSPGTIIVGIDGFRGRAARTGKHSGTKRGVIRDESGKCIGAWCEVYRSDWSQPAREEVSLAEYNTGKAQWAKMPETMIKKVAEMAALRMAFPDELGGIYGREEMDQAESPAIEVSPNESPADQGIAAARAEAEADPGEFKITFGTKFPNMTIAEAVAKAGLPEVQNYANWLADNAQKNRRPMSSDQQFFKVNLERFANRTRERLNPAMAQEWQDEDFDTAFDAAKAAK